MFSWLSGYHGSKKTSQQPHPINNNNYSNITNKPPIEITIFTYYRKRPAILLAARNAELRRI